jgi:RNA polymerase sigma factor (sigma-70 family)
LLAHADLWRRWRDQRDYHARDDLVEVYHYLAKETVRRLSTSLPPNVDREEATAEAVLGLIIAIERFDPDVGAKFTSYAIAIIRGVVLEWLRKGDWVPRRVREQQRDGEEVLIREVVSLDSLLAKARGRGQDDEDTALYEIDRLRDLLPGPEAQAFTRAEIEAFHEHFGALSKWDQELLRDVYWGGLTREQIADKRGLKNLGTVTKHTKRALMKLRELFRKGED